MIDKNKPLLAWILPVLLKPLSLKFGVLFGALTVATVSMAYMASWTTTRFSWAAPQTLTESLIHSGYDQSATNTYPPGVRVSAARPILDDSVPQPQIVLDQCLNQLMHGPSVEAKIAIKVQPPEIDAIEFQGLFFCLGQASGFSKTGIQMIRPADSEASTWVWQISRGKTCLTLGTLLGNNRKVEQQPAWFNTNTDQFRQQNDGYGSPISLMQWAKMHFRFQTVNVDEHSLELAGNLLPNVAQSWGDGTHLTPEELKRRETDPRWLSDHVLFPLPHEIRLRFSNQPNTARTLQELQLISFVRKPKTDEVSSRTIVNVEWSDWKLAPDLSPNDFPLQLDSDQMADTNSVAPIR